DGDGAARISKHAGLEFRTEDDGSVLVDIVTFGGFAQQKGVDFDWLVQHIEVEAQRPPKELFYIPALALLGLICWLQLGRARKHQAAVS
ncbi:MAG: DUF3394 domain-containing protein, partial [Paracoccaceae bacterium]